MKESYSVYEAKTRFSEILRQVRQGRPVVITDRRVPVARVVGYRASGSFEERVRMLRERGVLQGPAKSDWSKIKPIATRPGALKRFLADRHRY